MGAHQTSENWYRSLDHTLPAECQRENVKSVHTHLLVLKRDAPGKKAGQHASQTLQGSHLRHIMNCGYCVNIAGDLGEKRDNFHCGLQVHRMGSGTG